VRDCTDWGHIAPQRQNDTPDDYTKMVGSKNYRGGMRSIACASERAYASSALLS